MINYFSAFLRKNNGAEVCTVWIVLPDKSLAHSTYMKTGFPKDLSGLYAKEVHTGKEVFLFLTHCYILYLSLKLGRLFVASKKKRSFSFKF